MLIFYPSNNKCFYKHCFAKWSPGPLWAPPSHILSIFTQWMSCPEASPRGLGKNPADMSEDSVSCGIQETPCPLCTTPPPTPLDWLGYHMTRHLQQDTSEGKVLVTNYSGLLLCCCSVAKSRPTLRHPMDCSTPGLPVPHSLPSLSRFTSIGSVMPSNHLILCHPLLLSSIFPSISVFSSKLAVHIR